MCDKKISCIYRIVVICTVKNCARKKIYHLIDLMHFDEMWEQMSHVQVHVNTWQLRNEWSASRVSMLGPGTLHLRAPCQGESTCPGPAWNLRTRALTSRGPRGH